MPRGSQRHRNQEARQKAGPREKDEAGQNVDLEADREFARQVYKIFDLVSEKSEVPGSTNPEALNLASSILFLATQVDEFVKTHDPSDPRFSIAMRTLSMMYDIIHKRRNSIEAFFRGSGQAEGRKQLRSKDRFVRATIFGAIMAIREINAKDIISAPSVTEAVRKVWANPVLKTFFTSEPALRRKFDDALEDVLNFAERCRRQMISNCSNSDEIISMAIVAIGNINAVSDPYSATLGNRNRVYYEIGPKGNVIFDVKPGSSLDKALSMQPWTGMMLSYLEDEDDQDQG